MKMPAKQATTPAPNGFSETIHDEMFSSRGVGNEKGLTFFIRVPAKGFSKDIDQCIEYGQIISCEVWVSNLFTQEKKMAAKR